MRLDDDLLPAAAGQDGALDRGTYVQSVRRETLVCFCSAAIDILFATFVCIFLLLLLLFVLSDRSKSRRVVCDEDTEINQAEIA